MKSKFTLGLAAILFILLTPSLLLAQKPVSFVYHHSLIFLRIKVDKKDLLFLMDTGANISSIDNTSSQLLKLSLVSKGDSIEGTAGKEAISACKAKTFQVGSILVKNMSLVSRDLSRFIAPGHQKLNGILGTDFLKKYAVTIDYNKKTVLFTGKKTLSGKEKTVAFEMVSGIPRFEVRFNDTLTTFITYNSGVSLLPSNDVYVNVSHKQWSVLKGLNRYLTPYTNMAGDGVGGRVQLPVVKIHTLSLNGLEVQRPNIVIQPREGSLISDNAVGFFGNNLLEKYRKVTIDFLSNKVVLHTINKAVAKHTIKRR